MTTPVWKVHADRADAFYMEDGAVTADLWKDESVGRWVVQVQQGQTVLGRWVLAKGINAQHAQTQAERVMGRSAAVEAVHTRVFQEEARRWRDLARADGLPSVPHARARAS